MLDRINQFLPIGGEKRLDTYMLSLPVHIDERRFIDRKVDGIFPIGQLLGLGGQANDALRIQLILKLRIMPLDLGSRMLMRPWHREGFNSTVLHDEKNQCTKGCRKSLQPEAEKSHSLKG